MIGDSELLTDPQVLTHPYVLPFVSPSRRSIAHRTSSSVSGGKDIFGDGNIEVEVSMFEKNHVCNDYCKWSGFGLESFAVEEA
jgi:hypothetical protein